MMRARSFKPGQDVMVNSRRPETEHADGMRGKVTGVEHGHVCIECRLAGESHTMRIAPDELVYCRVDA